MHPRTWIPVVAVAALGVVLGFVGWVTHTAAADTAIAGARVDVAADATAKALALENWRDSRIDLLRGVARGAEEERELAEWLRSDAAASPIPRGLEARAASVAKLIGADNLAFIDRSENLRLNVGAAYENDSADAAIARRVSHGAGVRSELRFRPDAPVGRVHVDLFVPLGPPTNPDGVLAVAVNFDRGRFPRLMRSTRGGVPSDTVFVARVGDQVEVVDLAPEGDAPSRRTLFPAAGTPSAYAIAAAGGEGVVEGSDADGNEVIAAAVPVGSTSWAMLVKQDRSAVLSAARGRTRLIGALLLGAFGFAAAAAALAWRWTGARRRLSEALWSIETRFHEARFAALMRHANDAILMIAQDGRILDANEQAVRTYGVSRTALLGSSAADLRASSDAGNFAADFEACGRASGHRFEAIHRRSDGASFPVEISASGVDVEGQTVRLAIIRDVSARQVAEAHDRLVTGALSATANAVVITDPAGSIVWANPAFEVLTGYAPEEVVGRRSDVLKSGVHPPGFYKDLWDTILAGGVWRGALVNRRKDGRLYDEEMTITPVRSTGGKTTHFVAVKQDVTEHRRAEEALREARDFSETLIRSASVAIVGLDAEGRVTVWNDAAQRLSGWRKADIEGRDWLMLTLPPTRYPGAWTEMRSRLSSPVPGDFECPLAAKDGRERLVRWRTSAVRRGAALVGTFAFGIDVTEQRSAEAQLRQAQKMEAVGRLAGGVAHDFNNLLTVISGYGGLLLAKTPTSNPDRPRIEAIMEAAGRAEGLTRQLLTFSRRQPVEARVLDVCNVVRGLEKLLRRLIGEDVSVVFDLASSVGSVLADAGQLEQVIMNLVVNARDAMPHGGSVVVRTGDLDLAEPRTGDVGLVQPGRWVRLAIEDTGVGMPASTLAHLFEPFFTTKEVGKGTGLGLATVHGVVAQCGGQVLVRSAPGRGTTFEVFLPRCEPVLRPSAPRPIQPEAPSGTGTVLVAEDDPALRAYVRETLAEAGYTVLVADGAARAVEALRAYDGAVDLLLTDVVMPDRSGPELAATVHELSPATRTLFMSGYMPDALRPYGIGDEPSSILRKPFTPVELLFRVREALATPSQDPAVENSRVAPRSG